MKKLSLLLVLFTIFNCVDEPIEPEQRACVETTAALAEATTNFNAVTPDNYIELCNEYRIALQNQKEFCGDGNGNIQMLLEGLGDCTGTPPPNDCKSAQLAASDAATVYVSDASTENCEAYKLALENQITLCGDSSGNLQILINGLGDCSDINTTTTSEGCNGNIMTDVLGQRVQCNYDSTETLLINNVYIEERHPTDEDRDGIDDHFLSYLYITDGTAIVDANNNFISFENRTYVYSLSIFSLGTSGFEIGTYEEWTKVGDQFPFLNLPLSSYSRNSCTEDIFYCADDYSILNGIVTISGSSGNYELCFDTLLDFDDNCFKGNYTGDFIPITKF